jgi:hypothetical protein
MFKIRKQAKLKCLQNSSQRNGDNLKDVRREASRIFREKEGEYLKDTMSLKQKVTTKCQRPLQRHK